VVELSVGHHWPSLSRPERGELELGAMFVHHWGGQREDVAQQLGVQLEEPHVTPGTCVAAAELYALPLGDFDADTGEQSVELMDAGRLLFTLPGRSELLAGETYPEVLPNVSGHHYHQVFPLATRTVSTRRVSVLGLGGRDVSSFEFGNLRGPAELRWTSVGGWSPVDSPVVVSATEPLALRWSPGERRFDTLIRLRWEGRGRHPAGELLCRSHTTGRITIGSPLLQRVPLLGQGRMVRLTVETTARVAAQGPLPGGVLVRLTQSDTVTLNLVR
jgi:hypothetical protein